MSEETLLVSGRLSPPSLTRPTEPVADPIAALPDSWQNLAPGHSWAVLPTRQGTAASPLPDSRCVLLYATGAYLTNALLKGLRQQFREDGYLAFRAITAENRKQRLQQHLPPALFWTYYPFLFLLRRVLPRLKGFRTLCRWLRLTAPMSRAELMGRLVYTGFRIVDVIDLPRETWFLAQPQPGEAPADTRPEPSAGLLFRMRRVGKGGRPITVYKFRSMHPYAEYIQAYLHQTNGLDVSGKFRNDFRVSTGGRIIRKYWIDELPMLYNLLRGDLKLVGVRPISEHYFSLYPPELQRLRTHTKPGLLPPYYADMPRTFEQIVQSELTYLEAHRQAPFRTDLRYLLRILRNILIRSARSQ